MEHHSKKSLDFSFYLGDWVNSHTETKGIEKIIITDDAGRAFVQIIGAENGLIPGNWGSCEFHTYAYGVDYNEAIAFSATFKMDDKQIILAVNYNNGLIVVAGFYQFNDGSGRSDCLVREFFYRPRT